MKKITPFLWFDGNAEAAMEFYTSIFKTFKVGKVRRYPKGTPGPAGTVMSAEFSLFGQDFVAFNGGPMFKFTPAISFSVDCETQAEVDHYWKKLSKGGKPNRCGWLTDQFGLSWQIVPSVLGKLMQDKDPIKAGNVVQAMMQMGKLDIKKLEKAYAKKRG